MIPAIDLDGARMVEEIHGRTAETVVAEVAGAVDRAGPVVGRPDEPRKGLKLKAVPLTAEAGFGVKKCVEPGGPAPRQRKSAR